jgi:uncharacterized protein
MFRRRSALVCSSMLLLAAGIGTRQWVGAQGHDKIREKYDKREVRIAARDGVRLFTSIYTPKDKSRRYPILLNRTPYGVPPYGADVFPETLGPSDRFAPEGFIFAYQDVRGCMMSEGEFLNVRPMRKAHAAGTGIDESTDAWDTIDWLVKNVENNNDRVGMWGISYPGFYAATALVDSHPSLKAVSPQAPIADWFIGDDFHHNGALFLPHAFNFLSAFGQPRSGPTTEWPPRFEHGTQDGYRFFLEMGPLPNANLRHLKDRIAFWNDLMANPDYTDFWKERNLRPHLRGVRPATLTVGGWFDAEDLFGALNIYRSIEKQSPGTWNSLVMGPWHHGGWSRTDGESLGPVKFGSKTAVFYRNEIEFPFFDRILKHNDTPGLPEAYVFETGASRWRKHDTWPPKDARPRALFLQPGSRLAFDPPSSTGGAGFAEYVSDPAKPVPFIERIAIGMTIEYMVDDQRFASTRPDVLVFQTDVLNRDVTISGPVVPSLFVSTSGTDSDWVVKLIDVFPDGNRNPDSDEAAMPGYQQLVRGEPMRGRYRNGYDKPEAFVPGEVSKVEFTMPDVYHTFRRGHRLMVQIQSSWFPLVDRNPQKFVDIYRATEADFEKASQRVYYSGNRQSAIRVMVEE